MSISPPCEETEGACMILNKILRQLLDKEGVSLAFLAKKTGIPHQTLHNWAAGVEPRSLKQVKTVATYLNVSLDYLCFGETKKECSERESFESHRDEINAGIYEVVLKRVKHRG